MKSSQNNSPVKGPRPLPNYLRKRIAYRWRVVLATVSIVALLSTGVILRQRLFFSKPVLPSSREQALQAAIAEFETALRLDPTVHEAYAGLSQAYKLRGMSNKEVEVWQQAAQANPNQTWPYLELAKFYREQDQETLARTAFRRALAVDPIGILQQAEADDRVAQTFAWPELLEPGATFSVKKRLQNGWTLLGYRTDEAKLARGEPATLVLFWRVPPDQSPDKSASDWRQLGGQVWIQVLTEIRSLVENGSFTMVASDGSIPGFPAEIYKADPAVRYIETMRRGDLSTRVGVLANNPQNRRSSMVSRYFPVRSDTIYLQAGWIQTEGGLAYLGYQWQGQLPQEERSYSYTAKKVQSQTWRHYTGLAEPLPGSKAGRVWLLNVESVGTVRFDNVTWIPIPNPVSNENLRRILLRRYVKDKSRAEDETWRQTMASLGPAVLLHYRAANGWVMLGYTTDEAALAAGEATPLAVYWQGSSGVEPGSAAEGWHRLNDSGLWVQISGEATNLITNGDFERGTASGVPIGFPLSIYKEKPIVKQVRETIRNGEPTRVGVLANDEYNLNSSFVSEAIPIHGNTLFLEGGWIRAPRGNAFLGYRWFGRLPAGVHAYAYVASKVQTKDWRHVAGVATPLTGSKSVSIWLLNFKSAATVAFDDIFFVPIDRPGT